MANPKATVSRPIRIIEAPSNLGLKPPAIGREPGTRRAPDALKRVGLHKALKPSRIERVDAPAYTPDDARTINVRNMPALARYGRRLADAVEAALSANEFPVVLGGDCSILLGSMLALRRRGQPGLLFLDGHTDFYLPEQSASGGGAGMDLAFVTGWGPDALTDMDGLKPYVRAEHAAMIGDRDTHKRPAADIPAAANSGMHYYDLAAVRRLGVERTMAEALSGIARDGVREIWLHLDVDVLDDAIMPAVDSRQPDGFTWEEMIAALRVALASGQLAGLQVTIFDPDLDPDGTIARNLSDALVQALRGEG